MRTASIGGSEPLSMKRRTLEYDAVSTSIEKVESGLSLAVEEDIFLDLPIARSVERLLRFAPEVVDRDRARSHRRSSQLRGRGQAPAPERNARGFAEIFLGGRLAGRRCRLTFEIPREIQLRIGCLFLHGLIDSFNRSFQSLVRGHASSAGQTR